MARCPLRQDMLGEMPKCDPECAWLVEVHAGNESMTVCAMTLVGLNDYARKALNEVDR